MQRQEGPVSVSKPRFKEVEPGRTLPQHLGRRSEGPAQPKRHSGDGIHEIGVAVRRFGPAGG
jgi:hypothetical protein